MKKPCKSPGCGNVIEIRQAHGYCQEHAHKAKHRSKDRRDTAPDNDPAAIAFRMRSAPIWRRLRRIKLLANPLCEDPHGDHKRFSVTVSAEQVHHIKSIADNPELAYDMANLMSVCMRCHAKLSGMERRLNQTFV